MKNNELKELFENIIEVIFNECGIISFISEYMELLLEENHFITISTLLKTSEKNLLKLTEKIEIYENSASVESAPAGIQRREETAEIS